MARLVLEDGSEYRGKLFGAARSTPGEVGKESRRSQARVRLSVWHACIRRWDQAGAASFC